MKRIQEVLNAFEDIIVVPYDEQAKAAFERNRQRAGESFFTEYVKPTEQELIEIKKNFDMLNDELYGVDMAIKDIKDLKI